MVKSAFGFLGAWLVSGLVVAGVGCAAPEEPSSAEDPEGVAEAAEAVSSPVVSVSREVIEGDVAHYTVVLRLGDSPSAEIAIHRVVREKHPWIPRKSPHAVMFLHGDFATFSSNFLSPGVGSGDAAHGMASYLAAEGIDVWGLDRRWTRTAIDETDFSDYAGMTLAQSVDDTELALAFARAARLVGGHGHGKIALGGFSHGGQVAYEVVAAETQKPIASRHVNALVPIDIYDAVPPGDDQGFASACENRDFEQAQVDAGITAGENTFFALMGELAQTAPNDPSPIFPNRTNRSGALNFMGRTWVFFAPTAHYHLSGGVVVGNQVPSLRYSPEDRVYEWLKGAPPWQSVPEGLDLDNIWCADGPRPLPDHVADIAVPIFYLGAKGGFGDAGLYTPTLTASSDVTTLVLSSPTAPGLTEDIGHGDLLFSDDAPNDAWAPLADWLLSH